MKCMIFPRDLDLSRDILYYGLVDEKGDNASSADCYRLVQVNLNFTDKNQELFTDYFCGEKKLHISEIIIPIS